MKADLNRVEDIVAELEHKEDIQKEKRMVKQIIQKDHENRPKKLGRYRFEEPTKAVLLSEELPKNLRSLQVVVDPVKERFLSLQKRNIIEVRFKAKPQQRGFGRKVINRKNMEL